MKVILSYITKKNIIFTFRHFINNSYHFMSGGGSRAHLPPSVGAEADPVVRNAASQARYDGAGAERGRKNQMHQRAHEGHDRHRGASPVRKFFKSFDKTFVNK